jgi:hypothetical protein
METRGSQGQAHGCPVGILWTERTVLILLVSERLATLSDTREDQHHAAPE